ncbi:hypothetical protein TSH100_04700 [Azospirillum sp. TSH100]|nr:hypothetical protein TSH100_04700 [Azospirillum sp. TSH100]
MLDLILRSTALVAGTLSLLTVLGVVQPAFSQPADPAMEAVVLGVSGPLTGQYAQYGAQWQRGFDLALDQVNAGGGIQGRPLRVCVGQGHQAGRAGQKPDPKPGFALADRVAECRLRQPELGRRPGEAAFTGDGDERQQIVDALARHS